MGLVNWKKTYHVSDEMQEVDNDTSIRMLSVTELEAYEVTVNEQGSMTYKNSTHAVDINLLEGMYIVDENERMYVMKLNWIDSEGNIIQQPLDGPLKHSSFLGPKKAVRAAGHIGIEKGRLVHIDNISGHFRPAWRSILQLQTYLTDRGINLDELSMYKDQYFRAAMTKPDTIRAYETQVRQYEVMMNNMMVSRSNL